MGFSLFSQMHFGCQLLYGDFPLDSLWRSNLSVSVQQEKQQHVHRKLRLPESDHLPLCSSWLTFVQSAVAGLLNIMQCVVFFWQAMVVKSLVSSQLVSCKDRISDPFWRHCSKGTPLYKHCLNNTGQSLLIERTKQSKFSQFEVVFWVEPIAIY